MKKSQDAPYFVVQSVDRVLNILQVFIEERGPLGVTEVASRLKLHKSVAHRMMATLLHHGYLKQNSDTDKYVVGAKAFELGSVFTNSTNLIEEGKLTLASLVGDMGLKAHLSVLENGSVLYLANMDQDKAKQMNAPVGQRSPIHVTALGKCLTAWMPEEQIVEVMANYDYERKTNKTIGSFPAFEQELRQVRERGYAVDDEESVLGMRCVAAPVRDYSGQVIAAVSISGTSKLIASGAVEELADKVKLATDDLSRRLGYIARRTNKA